MSAQRWSVGFMLVAFTANSWLAETPLKAGAAGYLLALTMIDQSWRPKIVKASQSH